MIAGRRFCPSCGVMHANDAMVDAVRRGADLALARVVPRALHSESHDDALLLRDGALLAGDSPTGTIEEVVDLDAPDVLDEPDGVAHADRGSFHEPTSSREASSLYYATVDGSRARVTTSATVEHGRGLIAYDPLTDEVEVIVDRLETIVQKRRGLQAGRADSSGSDMLYRSRPMVARRVLVPCSARLARFLEPDPAATSFARASEARARRGR